jgi:hypothetical protein
MKNGIILINYTIKKGSKERPTCDKKEDVHNPPDAQPPQGQQLAHRCARLAQAESVQA